MTHLPPPSSRLQEMPRKPTTQVESEVALEAVRIATSREDASRLWRSRVPGQPLTVLISGESCKIYASTQYHSARSMNGALQARVFEQPDLLDPNAAIRFVYSDDATMQCLAAEGDERRLNKRDCVGKSLLYLDSEVSNPRLAAIRQAIESKRKTEYYYTHFWNELTWHFRCTVQHFPELGEILVEIHDACEWQATWWSNQPPASTT